MVQVRGSCTLEDGSPLEDTLEDTLEGRVSGRRMELGRVWGRRGGSGGGCSVTLINQRPGASRGHKGSERPL